MFNLTIFRNKFNTNLHTLQIDKFYVNTFSDIHRRVDGWNSYKTGSIHSRLERLEYTYQLFSGLPYME